MNTTLVWSNILAYSLQVGLLVAVGAFVPALARMRAAGARLLYWQLLLAACLLLPWVRPWHREAIAADVSVTTVATSIAVSEPAPARIHISPGELLLYLLAAGVVARLAWLGVGFWRLRRYRRRAVPLENAGVWAEVLLSTEISSPVTFGWRRPVILLPERFPQLSGAMQQAILCHEDLHVERHDWLFTVAEELVRAALWFHPAIWWLLAEIQLAREQAVDSRVVRITQSRDPYVDALLEMAGARPELDLAPAPLFLRKRHLKQRVVEIIREATMSKTRWITALAASMVFLAGACWLVTGAFPLSAAPQMAEPATGTGGAVSNGPSGSVSADQLLVRDGGTYTSSTSVLKSISVSGISDQAKADLLARLPVHEGDTLPAKISDVMDKVGEAVAKFDPHLHAGINIHNGIAMIRISPDEPAASGNGTGHVPEETLRAFERIGRERLGFPLKGKVIKGIVISGLSNQAKADLLARLPAHVGDTLTEDVMINVDMALGKYDRRLGVSVFPDKDQVVMQIAPQNSPEFGVSPVGGNASMQPAPPVKLEAGKDGAEQLHVDGNLQALQLISRSEVVYPPMAKQANIQGTVELSALIGKDGKVQDLNVVRGHPLLVWAAMDAVKKWVYKPTTINGEPIEVRTEISVNFSLWPSDKAEPPRQIAVGSVLQGLQLITRVLPEYPAAAKQMGPQGIVVFSALIGKDGRVLDLTAVSGHPLLVQAAKDAVMQWVYKPTLLNGEPVEVKTTIDVNFTLQ